MKWVGGINHLETQMVSTSKGTHRGRYWYRPTKDGMMTVDERCGLQVECSC